MTNASPLLNILAKRITYLGPIRLDHYITEALLHPRYGYYTRRDPLGLRGDFITAPEISQIFGEMIGAWCGVIWPMIGQPCPLALVELGPGRATLLLDMLRALRSLPEICAALSLELVEPSPVFRAIQKRKLDQAGWSATWFSSLAELPDSGPRLIIANEFLDVLPCRQFMLTSSGLMERYITINNDHTLEWTFLPANIPLCSLPIRAQPEDGQHIKEGQVIEFSFAQHAHIAETARRIATYGGAGLFIDYGYSDVPPLKGSLRAFRQHQPVNPLEAPGETDLSFAVDFKAAARAAAPPAEACGPLQQRVWLQRLGFIERMQQLAVTIDDSSAEKIVLYAQRTD